MSLKDFFHTRTAERLAVILPFVLYLILTLPLADWVVDDAGISFAYARNLAAGHGLVAQPGLEPVEGYSNPLWVLLMAPFFLLHIFHPYWIPKLLSLVFVGLAYALLHRSIRELTGRDLAASAQALTCLSLNTSFVVWTCSGLENALFAALIAWIAYLLISYDSETGSAYKPGLLIGVAATLIALTRPDGIVYMGLFPLAILLFAPPPARGNIRRLAMSLAGYLGTTGLLYGGFILFRWLYFGLPLPNTYYMKGGPRIAEILSAQDKWQSLSSSIFSWKLWLLIPFVIVLVCVRWLVPREWRKKSWLLLIVTFLGGLAFMIMPTGWMGEHRFTEILNAVTLQKVYLDRWQLLSASVFGWKLWLLVPFAMVYLGALWMAPGEGRKKKLLVVAVTFLAGFVYLIMPPDWMGEHRFATPFFLLYYALIAILVSFTLKSGISRTGIRRSLAVVIPTVIILITLQVHIPRLQAFYRNPVVAFENITQRFALKFNRYADVLGETGASVLIPDVGATLYYSNLRVYDLAGLTDPTIARTIRRDREAFYNYVFEDAKPTFIHTHGNWTLLANLDADDRFRRDYTAISEYHDDWIERATKRNMMSGDYVRLDALSDTAVDLGLLRAVR